MDGAEPVSVNEFFSFTLQNTAMRMSHGLTVWQQYLNIMRTFSYDANDKTQLQKTTDEEKLERALEMLIMFIFLRLMNPSASLVTRSPSINRRSGG